MKLFVGIDPGLDGAVGVVDASGKLVATADTPSLEVRRGQRRRRHCDVAGAAALLRPFAPCWVFLEDVHAMPGQGVSSCFTFGRGLGMWEGLAAALGCSVTLVSPVRWKKVMLDGMGKEKDASRLRARQLFPTADLSLKKHHGRGDALLLAEFGRRSLYHA